MALSAKQIWVVLPCEVVACGGSDRGAHPASHPHDPAARAPPSRRDLIVFPGSLVSFPARWGFPRLEYGDVVCCEVLWCGVVWCEVVWSGVV